MEEKTLRRLMIAGLFALLTGLVPPGWAQTKPAGGEKPANNLETVHEKLKAEEKSFVTKYMELTDSEAKNFWPVYDDYQKDLKKIHERPGSLLRSTPQSTETSRSPTKRRKSYWTSGSIWQKQDRRNHGKKENTFKFS